MLRSGSGPVVFRLRCFLGNDDALVTRSWLEMYSKICDREPRLDIPAALRFSDAVFSERIRRFSKRQIHTKSFLFYQDRQWAVLHVRRRSQCGPGAFFALT